MWENRGKATKIMRRRRNREKRNECHPPRLLVLFAKGRRQKRGIIPLLLQWWMAAVNPIPDDYLTRKLHIKWILCRLSAIKTVLWPNQKLIPTRVVCLHWGAKAQTGDRHPLCYFTLFSPILVKHFLLFTSRRVLGLINSATYNGVSIDNVWTELSPV